MEDDSRIERLTTLLEEALDLVVQADATRRLAKISLLCREAAELAGSGDDRPAA